MSSITQKVKNLVGKDKNTESSTGTQPEQKDEQKFNILPHPTKTNDPADLQPSGGLRHNGAMDAFNTPGPFIPSDDVRNNIPAPATRDELRARQADLN